MRLARNSIVAIALLVTAGGGALAQTAPASGTDASDRFSVTPGVVQPLPLDGQAAPHAVAPPLATPLQPLLDFKDADIKFNLQTLMNTLRDNRHEGWVLAAYPDPKTSRPLIGAGFSLDVPQREHPQRDAQNPNQFLEPSSAALWQAAGLDPQRLQTMLEQYDRELSAWRKKNFRRKIKTGALFPEVTEDDATRLLRISTIQAIHNGRAYCRNFDQLTGSQQMALTQLVFQMGVNLEEFTQFLAAINQPPGSVQNNVAAVAQSSTAAVNPIAVPASFHPDNSTAAMSTDAEYWHAVQETLIHSDWARRYSTRAVAVIAMFDPNYASDPWQAEAKVRGEVHPLYRHRRRAATVRTASAAHKKSSARRTHKS